MGVTGAAGGVGTLETAVAAAASGAGGWTSGVTAVRIRTFPLNSNRHNCQITD